MPEFVNIPIARWTAKAMKSDCDRCIEAARAIKHLKADIEITVCSRGLYKREAAESRSAGD